jgi:hypothetical protein
MESNEIIFKLTDTIKQLKQLHTRSLGVSKERVSELEKKETVLITKLVGCFHEIFSDNFIQKNEEVKSNKENKSTYWSLISKHFNTPVTKFCIIFEKNESNNESGNQILQKEKNWIRFSILEKSFSDSINEIYKQGLDEIYYEKDAIIRKYKSEINNILKDLQEIQFINILSKDYEKYLDFLKKGQDKSDNKDENFENDLKIGQSPIINKRNTKRGSFIFSGFFLNSNFDSDISNLMQQNEFLGDDDYKDLLNCDFGDSSGLMPICEENNEEKDKKFTFQKFADFSPSIVDNFYTFKFNKEENERDKLNEEEKNAIFNSINDIIVNEEELNSSKHNEKELKHKPDLELNPKKSKCLPTDNLYEIDEKTLTKEYNKNDKLTYKKKKRPISNCLLLYLNKYYQKAPYHKFFKHNLYNRPISLKHQNYQCYICHKNFSMFLGIPIEQIFWCSYYMRFVCKDCIDNEYFIIPYFVLKKWSFEKFSVSKKAKNTLMNWYDKPIIYLKKSDKLIRKIPQLSQVIEMKKSINNIFDFMKCENKFKFVEEALGEYEYLALKEYIFSLRDLVEINNKTFYQKLVEFKNKFVKHLSGECSQCLFKGEICNKCGYDEKIFFYDFENVFYCKTCKKSFHRKCIGLVGHVH